MDFKVKEEFNEAVEESKCYVEVKDELCILESSSDQEEVMNDSGSGEEKSSNYISSYQEFLNALEKTPPVKEPKEANDSSFVVIESNVIFKCEYCDYKTDHHASYVQHLPVHLYPYKCIECRFGSRHRFVVMNHYQMNHVGDTAEASHTFFEMPEPIDLKADYVPDDLMPSIESISTDDSKIQIRGLFECPTCDYSTTTPSSLDGHMKMHLLKYPYKCNKCDFTAQKSFTVFNHYQLNHVNDKNNPTVSLAPFTCHVCNFVTPNVEAYDEHALNCYIRKHCYLINNLISNANHFRCNMCDFEASHSFVLRNHVRMAHEFKNGHEFDACIPVGYLSAIVVKDEFTITN